MSRNTLNDLIHTNQEYEKLKKGSTDRGKTPRETPDSQGPGRQGYDKAVYGNWTHEELTKNAQQLGIEISADISREALVELLESRDATLSRSGSQP